MRFILAITALLFVVALPVEANSPALIQGIRDEYKAKVEVWTLSMQTATTAEAQQKIWAQRPDAVLYATKMWTSMKP